MPDFCEHSETGPCPRGCRDPRSIPTVESGDVVLSAACERALRSTGETISEQCWSLTVVKRPDGYRAILSDLNSPSFTQTCQSEPTLRKCLELLLEQAVGPILGSIEPYDPKDDGNA